MGTPPVRAAVGSAHKRFCGFLQVVEQVDAQHPPCTSGRRSCPTDILDEPLNHQHVMACERWGLIRQGAVASALDLARDSRESAPHLASILGSLEAQGTSLAIHLTEHV